MSPRLRWLWVVLVACSARDFEATTCTFERLEMTPTSAEQFSTELSFLLDGESHTEVLIVGRAGGESLFASYQRGDTVPCYVDPAGVLPPTLGLEGRFNARSPWWSKVPTGVYWALAFLLTLPIGLWGWARARRSRADAE